MEIVFWLSVFLIVYAYAGYPLSLALLKSRKGKKYVYDNEDNKPVISIIIAAANEEGKIGAKLENTLALMYPYGSVEIIVTLDGATDNTAQIVEHYINLNQHRRILLLENERGGKESAQLAAVRKATGDIFVFTDVATKLGPYTLHQLADNFFDPRVGAVDGMSRIESRSSNEGLYLKYENKIREYESVLGSLVTMGGCLFAVRREIVQKTHTLPNGRVIPGFRPDRQSDFRTALMVKTAGYQAILDQNAVAVFADAANSSKEFERKHRTVVRGLANFFDHLYLLNPKHYGLFSYQLFCHKMCKWLVPFFMITTFVSNVALVFIITPCWTWSWWFWYLTYFGQVLFYIIAILSTSNKYAKIIHFFAMSNLAILKAWLSYIRGERYVSWNPTKR